jgi:hypothetical protein
MDQGKTGPPKATVAVGRADRPLGRGLEDVSHLFLSQKTEETASQARDASHRFEPPAPAPAAATGTVVLRPSVSDGNDRLGDLLMEFAGAIEDGLRGIDTTVPCDPYGEIDLLAVDRANQLAIVDYDTFPNDRLVLRGIGHFDWILRNLPIVRRMYQGRAINFSAEPRLLLLAPDFSPLALGAARQIPRPRLCCVRYRFVETSGGPGIFFEPVVAEGE